MSNREEEDEFGESGSNVDWSPFKQFREASYSELRESFEPTSVRRIIETCFTKAPEKESCDLPTLHNIDSKLPCYLPVYISPASSLNLESDTINSSLFHDSINHTGADVWYLLVNNRNPVNIINKYSTRWWQDFATCLQLDTKMPWQKGITEINIQRDLEDDENGKPDPIYSAFGRLMNGFYVSGDGHVFRSKVELEAFKQKMADMKVTLASELETIRIQHQQLQAKRAEQKRLLSQRTESHESESEEAATELVQLKKDGQDKAKPTERKPALFSSMFSFAKSGIQGFFEKTSPNPRRRGTPVCSDHDNDESDLEDIYSPEVTQDHGSSNKVLESCDHHDEFTRQMQNEGGLTYQGNDRTVHQLSYQGLPPPLSLSAIKTEASNKV